MSVFCCLVVPAAVAADWADGAKDAPLSFAERVACFETVEDVYWDHRIWPAENQRPKPPHSEAMTREQVVAKVERSLEWEAALEQVFGESLSAQRVQAELDRIARGTQHPDLLRDVFAALDDDPFLIAECYVRPRLAERLVKERYAWDQRIHRELRDQAEAELVAAATAQDLEGGSAVVSQSRLVRMGMTGGAEPGRGGDVQLTPEEWDEMTKLLAARFPGVAQGGPQGPMPCNPEHRIAAQAGLGFSPLFEEADRFSAVAVLAAEDGYLEISSATWLKPTFHSWLLQGRDTRGPAVPKGGTYTLPRIASGDPCLDDTWRPTAGSGPPTARSNHTGVWTGAEMIVWGGYGGSAGLDTGGRYDAATDSWLPTSTISAPSARWAHTAVWTGAEMIVWGGTDESSGINTGGRYEPVTDSWTAVSTTGAPVARWGQLSVWTGTRMVVWGGYDGSVYHNTGGVYDPATDTWTATSAAGAPSPRYLCAVVWTGSEMIVWGGYEGSTSLNTGGRYDPSADGWTATSTVGAPGARYYTKGVWTGTEMIVWGGHSGTFPLNDGGRYDPATDSWTAMTNTGAPSIRYTFALVWSGGEMIVWGGFSGSSTLDTGGRYDPNADSWTATSTTGAPGSRRNLTAVWTGAEMIVWGGSSSSATLSFDTGGRYDPLTDSWTATSMGTAPAARHNHRIVWTGSEMIVWGGYNEVLGSYLNTGGRYDPATDSWVATTTSGAPSARSSHAAVWTGEEMVVWGGYGGSDLNTGGCYDPALDSWTATSTSGAPPGRYNLTGVWTGTEMIVWGGWRGSGIVSSGGRYDPVADSWTLTSSAGAPTARQLHTAVWTGDEMIVWGGWSGAALGTGARYDPFTDSWTATAMSGWALARYYHSAVWTGTEMIVWGGYTGSAAVSDGARYNPATDTWAGMSATDEPAARSLHTIVWTGSEAIVWGGQESGGYLDSGGRYNPAADTWKATATRQAPSARTYLQSVWTGPGTEMITWSGVDISGSTDTGGRYCASGVLGIDWGDAPDPGYPTLLVSGGARHPLHGSLFLGASADGEADGQPTAGADGDDFDGSDDEDGVTLPASFDVGFSESLSVTASAAGLLNAWIDFNGDGDWIDPGEQVFTDEALAAGVNGLDVVVPLDATSGPTFARFRLDSGGGLAPEGLAIDGEVEDYVVVIAPTAELAVTVSDSPDPVGEGGQLSYFVTVANNGGLGATGVVLADTLPPEVVFVSADPGAPVCTETAGVVTCGLGSLAAGASTQVEIVADVPNGVTGPISNQAEVTLDQPDPVSPNNSVSVQTTVVDAAIFIFSDNFESGDTGRWSATVP